MHTRGKVARGLAAAALLLLPPLACVDLFHATTFQTACDVDAAACASPGGATDFCQWSHTTARANALRACAWLGACAGPVGENAFGPCVVRATLAYDCAANPNRVLVPGSATHAFWDRLWQVNRCTDVVGASFPPRVSPACGASATSYASCFPDSATLLACGEDGGAPSTLSFENCAAFGQTCATSGAVAACGGSATTCSSAGTSCVGTQLHDCDSEGGPFDLGVDCASFGAGACVTGAASACQPASEAGCSASTELSCDDAGTATGCPSGYSERVDCAALLGTSASCSTSGAGRPWDVARACTVGPCGPDSCGDSTSASRITGCARGASMSVDCRDVGFSGCATLHLPNDPTTHAVCVP